MSGGFGCQTPTAQAEGLLYKFDLERSSLISLRQASVLVSRTEPRPHLREAPARPLLLHHRASLEEYAISDPDTPMGAIRFLRLKGIPRGIENEPWLRDNPRKLLIRH